MKSRIARTLVVLMALSLVGTAELAQACQQVTQPPQTQQQTATPASDTTATPSDADQQLTPAKPAANDVLPNAPSAAAQDSQTPQAAQTTPANASSSTQTKDQQPLGTAAAEKATTRGGAASKPAGTALAGAKQKQSRGLLIKMGAVLAAGAALGTVYALSRSTSPLPAGAVR